MVSNKRFKLLLEHLGIIEYRSLGLFQHYSKDDGVIQDISERIDTEVERLDEDDERIDADLKLLLDHLGLEITDGRQIVKKKRSK